MKKLNVLMLLGALLILPFLNSCTTEDPTPPTIIITEQAGATYAPGTYVDYILNISSNADLVSLYIEESTLSDPASEILATVPENALDENFDFDNNLTSVQISYRYYIPASISDGSQLSITFEVDDKDATGSESVQFTVTAAAATISNFTAVLMGAQGNSTVGSFLDAASGQVYLQSDAANNQEKIDIVYYYGSTNMATICAPNDPTVGGGTGNLTLCEGWATTNATLFGTSTVTATDFDAMTDDSTISGLSGMDQSKMTDLKANDVVAFETADGKKGLFKVAALTTGSDGTITIDVKVQL